MSFRVEHSLIKGRGFIHLKNDDAFTATIIPSVGAMLHALIIKMQGKYLNLVDSYPPEEVSNQTAGNWFKGVKLSPWPCRIPGGSYGFKGEVFKLKKMFHDGTALHGLLFDESFNLVDEFADDLTASVLLRHSY